MQQKGEILSGSGVNRRKEKQNKIEVGANDLNEIGGA